MACSWQEALPQPEGEGKVMERSKTSVTNHPELGHKVGGENNTLIWGQGIHWTEFQPRCGSNGDLLSLAECAVPFFLIKRLRSPRSVCLLPTTLAACHWPRGPLGQGLAA